MKTTQSVAHVIAAHRDLSHLCLDPEFARCSCGWAARGGDYPEHVSVAVFVALEDDRP